MTGQCGHRAHEAMRTLLRMSLYVLNCVTHILQRLVVTKHEHLMWSRKGGSGLSIPPKGL